MAKKRKQQEEAAKAKAAPKFEEASRKISEKLSAPSAPLMSPLAQGNERSAPSAARSAETSPVADAEARAAQPRPVTNPRSSRSVSVPAPSSRGSQDRRIRRVAKNLSTNRDLLGMTSGQVINMLNGITNQEATPDVRLERLEKAEGIARYAKRVNPAGPQRLTVDKKTKKKTSGPVNPVSPLDITRTLDTDTDKEIAKAAMSGKGRGNAVVKAAIEDEMRWGGSDGEGANTIAGSSRSYSVKDSPRTGRRGSNPMYIRTGDALRRWGVTSDQEMFTPTPDEIVNANRVAVIRKKEYDDATAVSNEEYKRQRDELTSGLEAASHPDDQASYREALDRLDAEKDRKVTASNVRERDVARRGVLAVRTTPAPDTTIGDGWKAAHEQYLRSPSTSIISNSTGKNPLSLGQFVRTGVAIEAKRDRIGEVMSAIPLGAPRADTQPRVSQGRTPTLGGAQIMHPSVAPVRKRVLGRVSGKERKEYLAARKEHGALARMGSDIPAAQLPRLLELKEKIKGFEQDSEMITAGELASRKGVKSSYDTSMADKVILNAAKQNPTRGSGYEGVALQQIREAALRKEKATPAPDRKSAEALYRQDLPNYGRAPGATRASKPSLYIGSGAISTLSNANFGALALQGGQSWSPSPSPSAPETPAPQRRGTGVSVPKVDRPMDIEETYRRSNRDRTMVDNAIANEGNASGYAGVALRGIAQSDAAVAYKSYKSPDTSSLLTAGQQAYGQAYQKAVSKGTRRMQKNPL